MRSSAFSTRVSENLKIDGRRLSGGAALGPKFGQTQTLVVNLECEITFGLRRVTSYNFRNGFGSDGVSE